jgi:hypothetical protein
MAGVPHNPDIQRNSLFGLVVLITDIQTYEWIMYDCRYSAGRVLVREKLHGSIFNNRSSHNTDSLTGRKYDLSALEDECC